MLPFDAIQLNFCEALSRRLFLEADNKLHPELIALAFWLRKSQVEKLQRRFQSLAQKGELSVPRGFAFHIPPANVETLFVYSWILSLLVGNENAIRLPSKQSDATQLLFSILQDLLKLEAFSQIAATTTWLSYGHEEEVTARFSEKADLRLIWGGDSTISTIRAIPLKVTGKDLVFADRYAFAAFKQEPDPELFFRDLFWYDQNTCASPRTLFWVGMPSNRNFFHKLALVAEKRGYQIPLSQRLHKLTEVYRAALELPVRKVLDFGPLTVVDLERFDPACRAFGGNGLLFQVEVESLDQIEEMVEKKDQTLVHAGFSEAELKKFVQNLNGKGLDRLVPVGSALQFHEVWDGYDLLAELTKRVTYESGNV